MHWLSIIITQLKHKMLLVWYFYCIFIWNLISFSVPYSREENEVERWGSPFQILLDRKISQCGSSATCRKMTTAAILAVCFDCMPCYFKQVSQVEQTCRIFFMFYNNPNVFVTASTVKEKHYLNWSVVYCYYVE